MVQSSPGIFSYLPFALRVLNKIEAIIDEELQKIGLSPLLSMDIEEEIDSYTVQTARSSVCRCCCRQSSGRIPVVGTALVLKYASVLANPCVQSSYPSQRQMIKLKDRNGAEFCLGPTHEEEITALVADAISSYKQLPQRLYQMGKLV